METCSTKHYDNFTLYHYSLFNYKCIQNSFIIGGDYSDIINMVPYFLVRRCSKDTQLKYNITCKTDKEIIDLYSSFYIDTFTQKNVINPSIKWYH